MKRYLWVGLIACLVGLWCTREGFHFKKPTPGKPNHAPVLQALVASPSSVPPGTSLTISAYAYDPDGDPLTYQWTLPQGWSPLSGLGTSSVTLSAPFSYGTTDQVSVTVEDPGGGNARGSVVISTMKNLPPFFVGISVALSITTYTIRADLMATAQDPEGDPLTFTWRVGGVAFTTSEGPQALWIATNVPNTYLITATATDPYGNSATGSLTIQVPSVHIWPQYQYNIYNTGLSPYVFSHNTGGIAWSFTTSWTVWATPAIASDGTFYFGNEAGDLYALTPTGSVKWTFPTGSPIRDSPNLDADGTIYIGNGNGISTSTALYALNPDGSLKWSYPLPPSWAIAGPTTTKLWLDGTIYFASAPLSGPGKITALYPSGALKWEYPTAGRSVDTLALGPDGTLYSGFDGLRFYALNPDGTLKWELFTSITTFIGPSAIGADGTIYVVPPYSTALAAPVTLCAFNTDGTLKWNYTYASLNQTITSSSNPSIGPDGSIYMISPAEGLSVFSPDGAVKWQTGPLNMVGNRTPVIGPDGYILAGTSPTFPGIGVMWLTLFYPDGKIKWKLLFNEGIWTPAIGPDGTIYVVGEICCSRGRLYAIK